MDEQVEHEAHEQPEPALPAELEGPDMQEQILALQERRAQIVMQRHDLYNLQSRLRARRRTLWLERIAGWEARPQPGVQDPALLPHQLPVPAAAANQVADPAVPLLEPLTARETEVLGLLAQGQSNPEIAHTLGIARATVKVHVEHILGKLGAPSRTLAVVVAIRRGLIAAPDPLSTPDDMDPMPPTRPHG